MNKWVFCINGLRRKTITTPKSRFIATLIFFFPQKQTITDIIFFPGK
jgi:hypothetical protein